MTCSFYYDGYLTITNFLFLKRFLHQRSAKPFMKAIFSGRNKYSENRKNDVMIPSKGPSGNVLGNSEHEIQFDLQVTRDTLVFIIESSL